MILGMLIIITFAMAEIHVEVVEPLPIIYNTEITNESTSE